MAAAGAGAGQPESVALLDQVESDGEVVLGAYDGWMLAAANASSPLRGLVLTDQMRAMDAEDFFARLAVAREELGFHPPPDPTEAKHGNGHGETTAPDTVIEFELPRPLDFIVAARREPAYIGIAYITDIDDIAAEPQLRLGWRGIERVLHGVLGEDGKVGVLEERRDPQGVHEFVLRSPATEAATLYDGFLARPALAEGQVLSVHVFHPNETQPRHDEVRFTYDKGAPTSRSATEDGTGWERERTGAEAESGWIEFLSDALGVPR